MVQKLTSLPDKPDKRKRYSAGFTTLYDCRLSLWSHARKTSKTSLIEGFTVDRLSSGSNWKAICRDLEQEASLLGITNDQLVKNVLEDEFGETLDLSAADLGRLIETDGIDSQPSNNERDTP